MILLIAWKTGETLLISILSFLKQVYHMRIARLAGPQQNYHISATILSACRITQPVILYITKICIMYNVRRRLQV